MSPAAAVSYPLHWIAGALVPVGLLTDELGKGYILLEDTITVAARLSVACLLAYQTKSLSKRRKN